MFLTFRIADGEGGSVLVQPPKTRPQDFHRPAGDSDETVFRGVIGKPF